MPVAVRFLVDKTGTVSKIEAISGPEELRTEAIREIGKSGKWKPAIQNGHEVNSYKIQSIVFTLQNEESNYTNDCLFIFTELCLSYELS